MKMNRPLAYVTFGWSSNDTEARRTAAKYCRQVYEAGYSPICPRMMYADWMKDDVPQEHKDRVEMASEILRRCRMLVVCGDPADEQVRSDIALAQRLRIAASTLDGILKLDTAGNV